jgi:hypothetical protein
MQVSHLEPDRVIGGTKELEAGLTARFGYLLNLADIAQVLRYPNTQAVRKAHLRKSLPFQLVRIPRRRGWFATARTVAVALSDLDRVDGRCSNELTGENPMT